MPAPLECKLGRFRAVLIEVLAFLSAQGPRSVPRASRPCSSMAGMAIARPRARRSPRCKHLIRNRSNTTIPGVPQTVKEEMSVTERASAGWNRGLTVDISDCAVSVEALTRSINGRSNLRIAGSSPACPIISLWARSRLLLARRGSGRKSCPVLISQVRAFGPF
jgi:hypothetical protein